MINRKFVFLISAAAFIVLPAFTSHAQDLEYFHSTAQQVNQQVRMELEFCGLSYADIVAPNPPHGSSLAIVNRYLRILANFDAWEVLELGKFRYVYANPNGTYPHTIAIANHEMRVATPFLGEFAWGGPVTDADGVTTMSLTCRGQSFDQNGFEWCLRRNFTEVIANQLCRFGKN